MSAAHKKEQNKTNMSLKEILVVSRPFWWVNTAAPFVASYFIIAGVVDWTLAVGVLFFAFGYNLMMYGINDIYDYESDILNPRKVGVDGSVLAKTKHPTLWKWIFVVNIPLLVWLFAVGNMAANLWLILMLFMVVAYSQKGLRFKEIPLVDSFTSSFHYTSPFIYGGLLVGANELYIPAYIAFFVWVMANHAFGAIQDITPDREAGISSVATKLGASKTIILVLGGYVLAAILPVVFYGWSALLVSVLLTPYVVMVARTLPYRQDDKAPIFGKAWDQFLYYNYLSGFILTWALLFAFNRLPW